MQVKLVCAGLCALAMLPLGGAHAQSYPAKTVRVITPFPAGSGPDSALRVIVDKLLPKGTAKAIVDQISRDVAKALAEPDVRERFASFGYEPWPLSPAQTSAAMEADVRRYAATIERLNLQLD